MAFTLEFILLLFTVSSTFSKNKEITTHLKVNNVQIAANPGYSLVCRHIVSEGKKLALIFLPFLFWFHKTTQNNHHFSPSFMA